MVDGVVTTFSLTPFSLHPSTSASFPSSFPSSRLMSSTVITSRLNFPPSLFPVPFPHRPVTHLPPPPSLPLPLLLPLPIPIPIPFPSPGFILIPARLPLPAAALVPVLVVFLDSVVLLSR